MGTLPFELSGSASRVRKPERDAVVVGDGEANSPSGRSQAAYGRAHFERSARRPLAAAREGLLARRPCHRAHRARWRRGRSSGASRIGCDHAASPFRPVATTLPSSPPVTMRISSAREGEDRARMRRRPCAYRPCARHQHEGLLAQHEDRGIAEKMRTHHRPAPAASGRVRSATEGMPARLRSQRHDGDLREPIETLRGLRRLNVPASPSRDAALEPLRILSSPAACGR